MPSTLLPSHITSRVWAYANPVREWGKGQQSLPKSVLGCCCYRIFCLSWLLLLKQQQQQRCNVCAMAIAQEQCCGVPGAQTTWGWRMILAPFLSHHLGLALLSSTCSYATACAILGLFLIIYSLVDVIPKICMPLFCFAPMIYFTLTEKNGLIFHSLFQKIKVLWKWFLWVLSWCIVKERHFSLPEEC